MNYYISPHVLHDEDSGLYFTEIGTSQAGAKLFTVWAVTAEGCRIKAQSLVHKLEAFNATGANYVILFDGGRLFIELNDTTAKPSFVLVNDTVYVEKKDENVLDSKPYPYCPKCGSVNIKMFDSDNDVCQTCGYYSTQFPKTTSKSPDISPNLADKAQDNQTTVKELQAKIYALEAKIAGLRQGLHCIIEMVNDRMGNPGTALGLSNIITVANNLLK